MYAIKAKLKDYDTFEGNYKNRLIAEKHKKRLEKKNPGVVFKIEPMAKENKYTFRTFYAVKGHIEREEL